jgi:hypothetical protein
LVQNGQFCGKKGVCLVLMKTQVFLKLHRMHPRERLALLLKLLLAGHLKRNHPGRWKALWTEGLLAHATPVCKLVRAEGCDVFLQATTPTVQQDEAVSMGEIGDIHELALYTGHPSDCVAHVMNLLPWKAFPSYRNDHFLLVAIDKTHPDYRFGRKTLNDTSGFVKISPPGIRVVEHRTDGLDYPPPGVLLILFDASIGGHHNRLHVIADTLGGAQSLTPVDQTMSQSAARMLAQWSPDCQPTFFLPLQSTSGAVSYESVYGTGEVARLHARGFLLSWDNLRSVQQHRRSQRFGGFQPASIKRVKRELDDLLIDLGQYDTGGFPHLEETPGVAMAPVAVAPAASKMDWQPADGAILAIMARSGRRRVGM